MNARTVLLSIVVLMASSAAVASVMNRGTSTCTIKSWDKAHYELNCDPRYPKVFLRTPAEWVKKALKDEKPVAGNSVEVSVTGEQLRSWIDMNKKVLAKAATEPTKKGEKK